MALIIAFKNVSSLAPVSDYEYQVLVGDGTKENSRLLEQGMVKGHHREDGWEMLLDMFKHVRVKTEWNAFQS